jgi:hypothetical protein
MSAKSRWTNSIVKFLSLKIKRRRTYLHNLTLELHDLELDCLTFILATDNLANKFKHPNNIWRLYLKNNIDEPNNLRFRNVVHQKFPGEYIQVLGRNLCPG